MMSFPGTKVDVLDGSRIKCDTSIFCWPSATDVHPFTFCTPAFTLHILWLGFTSFSLRTNLIVMLPVILFGRLGDNMF